ncbi:MAG: redoxin domain-containing protein [Verrucomicrobia bacterium]|nr:redoxin domain-containing protein [Cytophagales bacterium]
MLYEFENEIGELTTTVIADYTFLPSKARRIQIPGLGDTAPNFVVNQAEALFQHLDTDEIQPISLHSLLAERPLVLSFFDPEWSASYAELSLAVLERAYSKIRALGGELVVLTPVPVLSLGNLIRKADVSFPIFQDTGKVIAAKYGIYSLRYPAYQRISGIEKDVLLPATFVISQNKKIIHFTVDEKFDNPFITRELLTAVYSVK